MLWSSWPVVTPRSAIASVIKLISLTIHQAAPAFPGWPEAAAERAHERSREPWKRWVISRYGLECEITGVASTSTTTSPPSLPGAARPASFQARSRGAARIAQRPDRISGQRRHRPRHHRAVQIRLGAQHPDVSQAVPAQRHGQVTDGLPRIMDCPRRAPPGQALRQPGPEPGHPQRRASAFRLGIGRLDRLDRESAFGLGE